MKDEIINWKGIVIKKLQDENARLKVKCENRVGILESNHNDLAQYGRRNSVVFSGIHQNVPGNNLKSMVISVLSDIDVQVELRELRNVIELTSKLPKHRRPL